MDYRRYTYSIPIIGLFIIAKLGFASTKSSDKGVILQSNDQMPEAHYHGSHSSHASHHSHYSCMLSRADSIGSISTSKLELIKSNLVKDETTVIKAFLSNSTANSDYDGENGFNGEAFFVVIKQHLTSGYGAPGYEVKCIAIPSNNRIKNYYIYYEHFKTEKECNMFLNSIETNFDSRLHRSGYREAKEPWMYKL
jgi:hypothetical protein